MKNFYFLTNLFSSAAGMQSNVVRVRDGQQPTNLQLISNLSLTLTPFRLVKWVAVLCLLVTLGVGNAWGTDITYTFTSASWTATSGGSAANWTSGSAGSGFTNNGIQVTTTTTGANGTSPSSFTNISQIVCTYNTNKSAGAGTIGIKIGSNKEESVDWAYSGSSDGRTANFTVTKNYASPQSGAVKITLNTTTNSIYLVSVKITYGSVVTYTASWHVNGDDVHSQTAASGTTLTAPASTPTSSDCDGSKVFVGWSASEIDGTTNTKPADLFTDPTTKTMPAADVDYYAVFATRTGTAPVFTKVTSTSAGTYVLVSENTTSTYKYLPNAKATSNPQLKGGITMTTSAGVTTLTNAVKDSMLWDLTSTGTANQYYVRPHDSTSIGLGTLSSGGDKIRINSDYKNTKWTITSRDTYNWQFVNDNATPMYLAVYNDSEWRCYNSNSTNQSGKFHLFKQSGGYSYSDYATTCSPATDFPNGMTIFIQAESTSAWAESACVKAWFNASGAGGAAQTTYWLFDATGGDSGKKLFATVVPSTGDLNQVTLQRFASNCSDFWNNNGTLTKASDGGSNTFRTTGSGTSNIAWNGSGVTMELHGDPSGDAFATKLADVTDQGGGVWSGTYENYAPANAAGTSQDFKIKTNYNGWIGNTGSNNNATLDGMKVGSTYDITATLDVTDHSLTMSKTFVKGTVHFDLQSHGSAIDDLTNVTAGSKISAPDEPSATGYTFGGWFTDEDCTDEWTFASDEVEETMTLYAKWTINSHTLTWNFDGGSTSSESYTTGGTKTYGTSITYPADNTMSKTGYEFDSWSTDATTMPDNNLTITAIWTANKYDVTLKPTSQTGSLTDQVVQATYGSAMPTTVKTAGTAIVIPERTGYSFTGWFDESSGGKQYYQYTGSPKTLSSANTWDKTSATNLYAQWSINSYTLTWSWGGGSTSATSGDDYTAAGSVVYNTALSYPADNTMSRNGYTFNGWNSDATNMPAENLTITAQWTANQYTVTLDNKSATTAGTESVIATFGQAIPTITPPTKTGYRFDGYWTTASGGTKYINADGTSAHTYDKYSADPTAHKLHAHWVAQITFSVNGVVDDDLTCDVTASLPSSADVPTACGDCWAFAGWDASPSCSTTPGHAGGEGAATHGITTPITMYAVFGKTEYQMITSTSGLVANDNYVVASSTEWALSNVDHSYYTSSSYTHTDAASADISSISKYNASGYYIYNPPASIIWKFTGTKDAGQLYNVVASKYVNLTSTNLLATTQDLKFSIAEDGVSWIIQYSTTNYLHGYTDAHGNGFETVGSGDWEEDDYSAFLYHQTSATYATVPSCETYTITWKVDDSAYSTGSPTEETNTCAGIETMPEDPDNDELDCAAKFMGWSETKLIGTGHGAPADLFTTIGGAPKVDEDKTFHAVFASVDAENTMEVTDNLTYSAIGLGYAGTGETYTGFENVSSSSSAKYAGQAIRFRSSYSGDGTHNYIQIKSKDSNTGIVTTSSGGLAKKVTITWNTNQSVAKAINVYGKNTAYSAASDLFNSSTYGTLLGTITYGTNTELTISGDYAFIGLCSSDGAFYMDNIAIKWESPAYKDYMTSCCDDVVTIGAPTITGSGTVTFASGGETLTEGDVVETCTASKTITATVTPAAGYSCTALSFTDGSSALTTSPTILSSVPFDAPTAKDYDMTFATNTTSMTLTTSATFSVKPLTAWTWGYRIDADAKNNTGDILPIPVDPIEAYIGQYVRFDITGYTPSDVIAAKQNYVYDQDANPKQPVYDTDELAHVGHSTGYYTTRGKAAGDATLTFKSVGNAEITQTMTIRVKALPTVTFVDNIHNKTDFVVTEGVLAAGGVLTSVVTTGVVDHDLKTPKHADVAMPVSGNECEQQHLHLVGWIYSEWSGAADYMAGTGSKPSVSALTGAKVGTAEGFPDNTPCFFEPNDDINMETWNGKTFYAVWAIVE